MHDNVHLIVILPEKAPTLHLLLASLTDVADVGEEVVALRLGHGLAELHRVLEHADQDLQTVEVGVLRRDHLENGLRRSKGEEQGGEGEFSYPPLGPDSGQADIWKHWRQFVTLTSSGNKWISLKCVGEAQTLNTMKSYLLYLAFLQTHPVGQTIFLYLNRKKTQILKVKYKVAHVWLIVFFLVNLGLFKCVCVCHCCVHTQRKEHFAYRTE